MWKLYQTAKTTRSRPSELLCVEDALAAYQFDAAVTTFGVIVENAAQERVRTGPKDAPEWSPKFEMEDLLSDDFHLPRPPTKVERQRNALATLRGLAGVKVFKAKAKPDGG